MKKEYPIPNSLRRLLQVAITRALNIDFLAGFQPTKYNIAESDTNQYFDPPVTYIVSKSAKAKPSLFIANGRPTVFFSSFFFG